MNKSNNRSETVKVLTKTTCNNESKNCFKNRPYFHYDLYGTNPTTSNPFTEKERNQLINQYENACKNSNSTLTKCCDPNDNRINRMGKFVDEELKKKFDTVKVERDKGEITSIYVCNPLGLREQQMSELQETEEEEVQIQQCIGYRKPTNYEMCKLLNAKVDPKTGKVTNLTPDCPEMKCEPNKPDIFANLNGYTDTRVEDLELHNSLMADDSVELKMKLNRKMGIGSNNRDIKETINRILTHNDNGNNLLHEAILNDKYKCTTYLLTFGNLLDLEKKNLDGNTALILACLKGKELVVNDLLKMGAEMWKKNNYKDTPLHAAIIAGNINVVRLLLSKGVNISEVNKYYETPLHTAVRCYRRNIDIIRLLVEYGSDLMTRNYKNETILVTLENIMNKNKNINHDSIFDTYHKKQYGKKMPGIESHQNFKLDEIRTYLQREYYNLFKTDKETGEKQLAFNKPDPIVMPKSYKDLIKRFPETNPSAPINKENKLDVDKLDIIYDEDLNIPEFKLYRSIDTQPVKANMAGIIEGFAGNQNTWQNYTNKLLLFILIIILAYIFVLKAC